MPGSEEKRLQILGIRGVPAAHGGFETFAEHLSATLVARGWSVVVYCQTEGPGVVSRDRWRGVERVNIPVTQAGPVGTVVFDWRSSRMASREPGLILTLGYNTAIFGLMYKLAGKNNLVNMDGIEWQRKKWGRAQKMWLFLNERLACWTGEHLIADHPQIKKYLSTRTSADKITTIPYGADLVADADRSLLEKWGLDSADYFVVIGRPEPENSILEIVRAFSLQPRGLKLVVLGDFAPGNNAYHKEIMDSASDEVIFPGAIYEKEVVHALRFFAQLYLHGHTVGGTNPSLVEALGAGSPVLAHDNRFNRWVAGEGAAYFADESECAAQIEKLCGNRAALAAMKAASMREFGERFTWDEIVGAYEALLEGWLDFPG